MSGGEAAALVRVSDGSAQILVTFYQAPSAPSESAPRLQMMLLGADGEAVGGPTQRVRVSRRRGDCPCAANR